MSGSIIDQFSTADTVRRLLSLFRNPVLDVRRDSKNLERANNHPGNVDFPPAMPVSSEPLMSVMIVVPAFAIARQRDPPEISRSIGRFVVAVTPDVSRRIDEPGAVVTKDRSHADSPQSQ